MRIIRNTDRISVVIEDNGIGRQKLHVNSKHNFMGSTLGTERLETLSKLKHGHYGFRVEDLNPDVQQFRGTRVTLSIPVKLKQIA